MKKLLQWLFTALLTFNLGGAVINFTGGTVTLATGATVTTNNSSLYSNVVSYAQGNFKLQYMVSNPSYYSMQYVGNYYGTGDVIHGHFGNGWLNSITIGTINGAVFDLQYFSLTSNTSVGGGAHTGSEHINIQGFKEGVAVTYLYRLPGESWGAGYTNVSLPDSFNIVDSVTISGEGAFCYGMDNFVFDQAVPTQLTSQGTSYTLQTAPGFNIPEPNGAVLMGVAALALTIWYVKRKHNN
jgi:hypothetical protein